MKIAKVAVGVLCWVAFIAAIPAGAKSRSMVPPDFSIKSIRIDPAEPYANSDMNVYVEVENVGQERVDNVQIVVNFSKLFEGQSETASLGPGEVKLLSSRK